MNTTSPQQSKDDNAFWQRYYTSPQYVKDFIVSSEVNQLIRDLEEKYALEDDLLGGVVGDYILRLVSDTQLKYELQNVCHLPPEQAESLKGELSKSILALDPLMRRYIQAPEGIDVTAIIEREGRVEEQSPIDYEKTLSKVIPQISAFVNEQDTGRIENIISSFYGQIRTEEQTRNKLMDARKIGGLEMDDQQAELVVNVLRNTEPIRKIEVTKENQQEVVEVIKEKSRQIMQIAEGSVDKYKNMLSSYVQQKDDISTVALFQAMAASSVLFDVLKENAMYKEMLTKSFQSTDAEQLKANILHPKFLQYFLRELYTKTLGFDEQTAAKYISQLSSILGKKGFSEYGDMAYFDMNKEIFIFTRYQ